MNFWYVIYCRRFVSLVGIFLHSDVSFAGLFQHRPYKFIHIYVYNFFFLQFLSRTLSYEKLQLSSKQGFWWCTFIPPPPSSAPHKCPHESWRGGTVIHKCLFLFLSIYYYTCPFRKHVTVSVRPVAAIGSSRATLLLARESSPYLSKRFSICWYIIIFSTLTISHFEGSYRAFACFYRTGHKMENNPA